MKTNTADGHLVFIIVPLKNYFHSNAGKGKEEQRLKMLLFFLMMMHLTLHNRKQAY